MEENKITRRRFLHTSAALVGTAAVVPLTGSACATTSHVASAAASAATVDSVPLNKTGVQISRLGLGTGSNNGQVQRALGQAGFDRLVRYAYERGVTYIDTADAYGTHDMVRGAIRNLPRERLFIQTKMRWHAADSGKRALETLDRFRRELGTDYIDSLLIHCTTEATWDTDLRLMTDAFDEAQSRKLIRLKGVSCHGLPALRTATRTPWVEVQLARVNPQGKHMDGRDGGWDEHGDVPAAMKEIKAMHARGRGVIGMKLVGNGDFRKLEDRERAMRYAMTCGCVDAVVVGFGSTAEIDEAIGHITRAHALRA